MTLCTEIFIPSWKNIEIDTNCRYEKEENILKLFHKSTDRQKIQINVLER